MGRIFVALLWLVPAVAAAEESLDITRQGIVYRVAGMDRVVVRRDQTLPGAPRFDLYLPPGRAGGPLPLVVFVNGVGDGGSKLKTWRIYEDWARLAAARGMAAILHEASPADPRKDVTALLDRVAAEGARLGIDPARIAVWACSANVSVALPVIMEPGRKLKAAVLYYGATGGTPIRADLPVLHVLAGRDGQLLLDAERELWRRVLEAKAPWTLVQAPTLPHAFDAVDTSDESRAAVAQTLAFLDAQLKPLPAPPPRSEAREILASQFGADYEAAARKLEAWVAARPKDAAAWMALGHARRNQGHGADAEKAYLEALALQPDDMGAVRWLAIVKAQARDCAGAAAYRKRLAERGLEDGFVLSAAGTCAMVAGQNDEGAKLLERAIAAGAGPPVVRYNLACAYARLGRTDEALGALEAAVAAGFNDAKTIREDADLASLRGQPRFEALLRRLSGS